MKKNLILLLTLLFAITCTFVSCDEFLAKGSADTKGLVEISLKTEDANLMTATKALSTAGTAPESSSIYWTYTATASTGHGVGAVTSEKSFTSGSETLNLSKGKWVFKIWGYATKDGDTYKDAVYYGEKEVTISDAGTVTVPYSKKTSITGKTLKKATVTFANNFGVVGGTKPIANTEVQYKVDSSSAKSYEEAFDLTPGEHTIDITYIDTSLDNEKYSGKIKFTAYAGYSYTISGSLNINGGLLATTLETSNGSCYEVGFTTNYQTQEDYTYYLQSSGDTTQTVTLPDAPTTAKTGGYKFVGWNENANGTGTTYAAGSTYTVTADSLLYAIWTEEANKIVTFNSNYGSNEVITVKAVSGTSVTLENAPTAPSGKKFVGWNTDKTGNTGTTYAAGSAYTVSADKTLYAIWTETANKIVTFDPNNASPSVKEAKAYTVNSKITIPDAPTTTPTGETVFEGWKDVTTSYACESAYMVTDDVTFTAQWSETATTHKIVSFNTNYGLTGTTIASSHPDYTIKIYTATDTNEVVKSLPGAPTFDSAFGGFLGWYPEAACTGTKLATDTAITTDDAIYYAKWSKGVAPVLSSAGRTECGWVQLWENGPKFAEFNVGSTITSYASVTATSDQYTTANVGGWYFWGGSQDAKTNYNDDHKTGGGELTGDKDTATKLWGSNWKMPTKDYYYLLVNKNTGGSPLSTHVTTWTYYNGTTEKYENSSLAGYLIVGIGDFANNSIFLPQAGSRESSTYTYSNVGRYWSSYGNAEASYGAYLLQFTATGSKNCTSFGYNNALSVRAILNESTPE